MTRINILFKPEMLGCSLLPFFSEDEPTVGMSNQSVGALYFFGYLQLRPGRSYDIAFHTKKRVDYDKFALVP